MIISLLRDGTAVIHGTDAKRISCATPGVLTIGKAKITVAPEGDVLPSLINGLTGIYSGCYVTDYGKRYELPHIEIKGGKIAPLTPEQKEIVALRIRADEAEAERDALRKDCDDLRNMFDTNALNFLIR